MELRVVLSFAGDGMRSIQHTADGVGHGERGTEGRHLRPVSVKILETVGLGLVIPISHLLTLLPPLLS